MPTFTITIQHSFGSFGQLFFKLNDDGPAFAQHFLNGHVGHHVAYGRLHHVLKKDTDLFHCIILRVEVEMLVNLFWVADFPDGEAADLDTLVLLADLVGHKGDVLYIARDNHILDAWRAEEAEAASLFDDVAILEDDGIVRRVDCYIMVVVHLMFPRSVSGATSIG